MQTPLLYFFNESLIAANLSAETRLAWKVIVAGQRGLIARSYFIDGLTGEKIASYAESRSLNRWVYDCGVRDGNCYLNILVGGIIYGRSEGTPPREPHPWAAETNNETNLLYDYLGHSHNYYLYTFGRNGANGQGGIGDGLFTPLSVSLAYSYVDYWDDSDLPCPNAMFTNYPPSIHFCRRIVGLDVVGHEYAHAASYYAIKDGYGNPSGLIYHGESGALEEALADIFGTAIDYYATGDEDDWEIFEDTPFGALRSLRNPTAYNSGLGLMPDRFYSPYVYCGPEDESGVHHNCSIVAKAAYLTAEGGTFNGCNIKPLGRAKEEAIFRRAQTRYFSSNTSFNEAYHALLAACDDLYPEQDCVQLKKALLAVELDQGGRCVSGSRVDPEDACTALDTPVNPTPTPTPAATPTPAPPPTVVILQPVPGKRVGAKQKIVFTTEEGNRTDCSITGRNWGSCTSSVSRFGQLPKWRKLKRGKKVLFYVRVISPDGQVAIDSVAGLRIVKKVNTAKRRKAKKKR